ncbi:MAG: hypothetical protein ACI9JN_002312 [Bacteroidia bacterium]|jgi:hypothetical protein
MTLKMSELRIKLEVEWGTETIHVSYRHNPEV